METTVKSESLSNVLKDVLFVVNLSYNSQLQEKYGMIIEDLEMWAISLAERKKLILCSLEDKKGNQQDYSSFYCSVELLKKVLEIANEETKKKMKWFQEKNDNERLKSTEENFKNVLNIDRLIDSAKENPQQNKLFVKFSAMTDTEVLSRFRASL